MQDYSTYGSDPDAMMAAMGPMLMIYFGVLLVFCALAAFLNWRVFSKAGYPGALGLVWLGLAIPLLNILAGLAIVIIWIWFAFAEWPVQRKAEGRQ